MKQKRSNFCLIVAKNGSTTALAEDLTGNLIVNNLYYYSKTNLVEDIT
jgi:hypothetical protein